MGFQECPVCKGYGVFGAYGVPCPTCNGSRIIDDLTGFPPKKDKDYKEGK